MVKRMTWQDRERVRQIGALQWGIERLEQQLNDVPADSEQGRRLTLEIEDRQLQLTRFQQQYERSGR